MLLWLDASDIDADGDPTNTFGGKVDFGETNPVVQETLVTEMVELANQSLEWSHNSKFDGNSQYLRVNLDVFDFGEDGTIFIVAQGQNTGTWRPILSKRGENSMGWQFRRVNTILQLYLARNFDWDDRSGGTAFNGEPHVWAMRKSEVRKAQWADGNLEFQVLDTGSVAPAPDDDLVIAARSQNGSIVSHSNVEVAEIIIYDAALSDEDVSRVQGYLGHKWGITEPMPEAHPYKNSKPVFENRPELLLDSPYPLLVGELVTIDLLSNRPVDQVVVADLPPGLSLSSDEKSIAEHQLQWVPLSQPLKHPMQPVRSRNQ